MQISPAPSMGSTVENVQQGWEGKGPPHVLLIRQKPLLSLQCTSQELLLLPSQYYDTYRSVP